MLSIVTEDAKKKKKGVAISQIEESVVFCRVLWCSLASDLSIVPFTRNLQGFYRFFIFFIFEKYKAFIDDVCFCLFFSPRRAHVNLLNLSRNLD